MEQMKKMWMMTIYKSSKEELVASTKWLFLAQVCLADSMAIIDEVFQETV